MVNEQSKVPLEPVSFDEFAPTSYQAWKEAAVESLKGAPFEKKLLSKTYEGITLEPIYTQEMAESFAERLSFPGAEDYLRGANAAGYVQTPWVIAQEADGRLPERVNAIIKENLAKGATAISFYVPQLYLEDFADLTTLFDGVCLVKSPLNIYCGASALPFLGLLQARIEKGGHQNDHDYQGCVGADPIIEYARSGKSAAGISCYMKQIAAAMQYTKAEMPKLKTIFIQGGMYADGGANAVQEVAAAMATAIAYLDALQEQGFTVDEVAAQIRFSFSIGANFFMEIAKLRAARVVWAQIVKAYGGSEAAAKMDLSAETSRFTASVYDPYVNILRATTQAFSGVVGGVGALTVHPFDQAVRPSDEHSRRIARNIQIMMQHEFNFTSPVDPAGGSWYVETLTGELAEKIWAKMQEIEAKGGILAALQDGSLQEGVAATLADRFKKLATRAERAVGTNMYPNVIEQPLDIPACKCLDHVAKQGKAVEKLDHSVSDCAKAFIDGAVYADVAKALCCGEEAEIAAIQQHRWTEQYEALRQASEDYQAKSGSSVKVFLANIGPLAQYKARADFSTSFMQVAKFEVLNQGGYETAEAAVEAALTSKADACVICSTDDAYPEFVPAIAQGIKAQAPQIKVLLAGAPAPELRPVYDEAGVDDYIHVKANCLAILTAMQNEKGVC